MLVIEEYFGARTNYSDNDKIPKLIERVLSIPLSMGYKFTITMDNYYTSIMVANFIVANRCRLIGTIR